MTMPDLWSLLSDPLVELVGWVLLHFVWQGALVAAVLAGALYLLRDHAPTVRYAVSCAALAGLLALPIGTGLFLSDSVLVAESAPAVSIVAADGAADGTVGPALSAAETGPSGLRVLPARVSAWLRPALPWMVMGWVLGVLVCSARLAGGAWRVRRLRRESTPASAQWQDRLEDLADRTGLRSDVALRISDHVDGPMVADWWRPVVLVPAGLLSGLPPDQVETLLLHELAHVRRHDVLVGRLQAVVETLLFFHPATWWISRRVRRAREACCDDLVVEAGSDRRVYAQALITLAERAVNGPTAAWTPAGGDGSLLNRIRRLTAPTKAPSTTGRRLSIVAAALLMVLVPAGLAACASQQSSPEAASSGAKASQALERKLAVVSVQDDSSQRIITVRGHEPVEIDSLDDGGYLLRYEGEGVDTLRLTSPKVLEGDVRAVFDSDSLARRLGGLRLRSDSLERVLLGDINPDSLMRLIQTRFNADSLKRVLRERFDLDSLEHRALQVRWDADRFARSLEEQLPDDEFYDWPADSTFDVDTFDREAVGPDLDVDSLIRRHEHRADSLHRHFEQLHERMEEERLERLREQARRLRERAERLEERAEEIEEWPSDSSGTERGGLDVSAFGIGARVGGDDVRREGEGRTSSDGRI